MAQNKFQTPTGMHDILPEDQWYYQKIFEIANDLFDYYGFQKIETPILENAEVFSKGVGLATDVVEKEMFFLKTKGGDFLALRPEGTAPIARAYLQHGLYTLPQPVKLWYFGPFFRYEKPQAGRYRQFWQVGLEAIGEKSSAIDAQLILILVKFLEELGFKNLTLRVNSIGDENCQSIYRKALLSYLRPKKLKLCHDCQRRLKTNPLRILDCKNENCRQIISQAPQTLNYLCEECHNHLKEVLEFLDELKIPYNLDPYLVRGLDYYTKTVFEIEDPQKPELGAIAGGGRYDKLLKTLGGEDTPACGWAVGIERIVEAMQEKKKRVLKPNYHLFFAQIGNSAKRKSFKIIEDLRKENIRVAEALGKDSLKIQLARAAKLKVKYTLILGQKEIFNNEIIIRDMETGNQTTVKQGQLIKEIKKRLKNK